MKNKVLFGLIKDENINQYVFFKVFIPGPKGYGWENAYAIDDFEFTFISGSEELLSVIKSPAGRGGYYYNGKCTALKNFINRDFYYLTCFNAWDFYTSDWHEIRMHPKKYAYHNGNYPAYPKQKKIYEVLCTEDYFDNNDIKEHENVMLELLNDLKLRFQLQEEMKSFI